MNRIRLVCVGASLLLLAAAIAAQDPVDKGKAALAANHPIMGDWQVIKNIYEGQPRDSAGYLWHIQETSIAHTLRGALDRKPHPWTYKVDDTKNPPEIDIRETIFDQIKDQYRQDVMRGIYKLEGKTLTISFKVTGNERATDFTSAKDSKVALVVMQRVNRLKPDPPAADVLGKALKQIEDKAKQPLPSKPVPIPAGDELAQLTTAYHRGLALKNQGRFQEALPDYEKAVVLVVRVYGPEDLKTAIVMNNLGEVYHGLREYGKAQSIYHRSLELMEKHLGKSHPDYAAALWNLARNYQQQGGYARAEPMFREALEIRKKVLGEKHPVYVETLAELAKATFSMGNYSGALVLYSQVAEVNQKVFGEKHPHYAAALHNTGLIYHYLGDYARAEPLFRRSLELYKEVRGEKHPEYASSLTSMARLHQAQGDYDRAEPLLRQALEIRKPFRVTHEEKFAISISLSELAEHYLQQGDHARAEPLLRESVNILLEIKGANDVVYALNVKDLGRVYHARGDYIRAESFYRQVLDSYKAARREKHPQYADALHHLARLYHDQGAFVRAEPHLREAQDIYNKVLGEKHSQYADIIDSLAALNQATSRTEEAWNLATRSMDIRQGNLQAVFTFSSEPTMRAYLESTRDSLPRFLSHVLNETTPRQDRTTAALTWVFRRKGVLLDTVSRFRQYERELEHHPDLAQKAARWRFLRQQLADQPLRGSGAVDPQQVQKQVQAWQNEADQLEADLHRAISQLLGGKTNEVDVAQVQRQLPVGAALVEFVRVELYDFKATGKQPRWKPAHYFAFVLTGGKDSPPHFIDLGPAEPVEQAIRKLREQIEAAPSALRFSSEKDLEAEFRTASRALFKTVFAPLQSALANTKVIYLAPDAELNRLAFEALVDDKDRYLIESYRFVYLSCGRDLVRATPKPASGTVVFAGPDFDLNARKRKDQVVALFPKADQLALRGSATAELRGLRWSALPGAAVEAADIEKALQKGTYGPVQTYSGGKALEDVFKRMKAPRVLHLATHGFFLEDVQRKAEASDDLMSRGSDAHGQERLRMSKNPLLRSGIVLAGANGLAEETTLTDVEDGWVTAEEIALMNLQGTDLVVLSACESGLGDIKRGEGVFGLRRAFLYAGARTLVTSLFKVPDDETRQMMQRFYGSLKEGKGKLESLHDAQLEIIRQRRKEHGAAHPFYWASFVLVGDSGELQTGVLAPPEQPIPSGTPEQQPAILATGGPWPWSVGTVVGLLLVLGIVALVWRRSRLLSETRRPPTQ